MKKIILILTIAMTVQCAYPANTTLDNIENSLYGFTYSNESDSLRVSRIEKSIRKIFNRTNFNSYCKIKKRYICRLNGTGNHPKRRYIYGRG